MFEPVKAWLNKLDIDFVRTFRASGAISIVAVLLSWLAFATIGPNWGIDFTGGTEIHLKFHEDVEIGEIRGALQQIGLGGDTVQQVNDPQYNEFAIRIQDATFGADEMRREVEERLSEAYGEDWIQDVAFDAEVGARLTVEYAGPMVTPQQVGVTLREMDGVTVQPARSDNAVVIRMPGLTQQIEQEIRTAMGDRSFEALSIDAVGPRVGGELRRQGALAIGATLALVLVYIAFRFDITFAPGAIAALIHDVSLTVGLFVLLQLEFNLPMIGALLTIVGYSLNDTIVIYDRIRENTDRYRREDLKSLVNVSINQTLSRTFATSFTTGLAITAFLVLGGPVIENFALAMLCGIILGTYSTIFVAGPMIFVMQAVKPRLQALVAGSAAEEDEERLDDDDASLTEAEKRRRERAAAQDREAPTG